MHALFRGLTWLEIGLGLFFYDRLLYSCQTMLINVARLVKRFFQMCFIDRYYFLTIVGMQSFGDHLEISVEFIKPLYVLLMHARIIFINSVDRSEIIHIKEIKTGTQ